MGEVGSLVILLSCFLCLCILLSLIKFLHQVLWLPIRIQYLMQSQGFNGPSYRFFYGNSEEIISMRKESLGSPMDLSHDLFARLLPHLYSWMKIYGRNLLHWEGSKPQVLVMESESVKEIMNNKDKVYGKTEFEGYVKKLFGDGILTSENEKWGKLRKIANHAFHGEILKSMTPAMITSVEMMLESWKHHEGKEIEVFEEFRMLTSEVISRTAFGSSYLEGQKIFDKLIKLSILIVRHAYKIRIPGLSQILKSSDEIESEKLEQDIKDSIVEIIKKREKAMTGEVSSFGTDFLGLLVKANHDTDENCRITVDDMVNECKTFYVAGHETTTSLLTWTVFLLSIHTDWQEKARQEVIQLFGQHNPNSEGIAKLKTMSMIINESLRLYPPAVALTRKVKREVRLGKLVLPANIGVIIPVLALHQDPQIWGEDVLLFKPERFSEGVAKATNHNPAVFLPFGLGPRTCVGMNFATNETKIALSMILQRYKFTLSPTYIHSPVQGITVRPQHGVKVMLHAL